MVEKFSRKCYFCNKEKGVFSFAFLYEGDFFHPAFS